MMVYWKNRRETMTTYWDNALLGSVRIDFEISTNDGNAERVRTTAYVPDVDDTVKVTMQYKDHAFKFQNKVCLGVRNGTPQFYDPAERRDLSRYIPDLEKAVIDSCNSREAFRRGQLPEGLIEVLRQGADIEPYVRMNEDYAA
jgi:hypothetical protein